MNIIEKTKTIKNIILKKFDIDFVGIADATLLMDEPIGHRPCDLLPTAKNIIVFGRKMIDGAVSGCFRSIEDNVKAAQSSYSAFVNEEGPNFLLVSTTNEIALYLEEHYSATAVPLPFGNLQNMVWDMYPAPLFADPYGQGMPLHLGKAAVAAGLGEMGWSNRFVTKEFGPRQIVCGIITDIDLECDAPYHGEKICDPQKCQICAQVCPTGAISRVGTKPENIFHIGNIDYKMASLSVQSCVVASMGMRSEFAGRIPCPDLIMKNDPTDEEIVEAFKLKPLNQSAIDHYPHYLCDRCLIYCPIGDWVSVFSDTGLTSFSAKVD